MVFGVSLAAVRVLDDVNGPHHQRLFFLTETLVNKVRPEARASKITK